MPGNEVGDRVHNFFAPDNLSQAQHHVQGVDGNWPVLGNNLWVGGQRHVGGQISNPKNSNLKQSDTEIGHITHSLPVQHGMNFTQSTLRPDFAKSQSQSLHPNSNGYVHGHQVFQTRQNEANLLGVDTESDHQSTMSRGFSVYESQQGNNHEHHKKISTRSEGSGPSGSPVSFNLFGGQQQSGQSIPVQPSALNEIQLLQQEVMFRKMQELQRHQQIQQLEARQQNSVIQIPTMAKQGTELVANGTSINEASSHPWATVQGSSNRLRGMVPQQVEQSLYGLPVSVSRGTQNQHSHIAVDKPLTQQISTCNNSFSGNQYSVHPDQDSVQDGTLVSIHGFQGQNMFEHGSVRGLNCGTNLDNLQEKSTTGVAPSQNAVSLDPTEEKILFGTDDNIWDVFGCNPLDATGDLNGLPSVQSGSWSALMQSAVAEISSNHAGLHEEWNGLSFQNSEISAGNRQFSIYNDSGKQQIVYADNHLQKMPFEHGERMKSDSSNRPIRQSSEQGSKWLSRGPLLKPCAEGNQIYENSPHTVNAAKSTSSPWTPQQSMSSYKPNGWSIVESQSPSEDAAIKNERENSLQHSWSTDEKGGAMNSIPNSSFELEQVKSAVGNPQLNRQDSSLNNANVIFNTSTKMASHETSQLPPNSRQPYWKHVDSSSKYTGSEASVKSRHHVNVVPQVIESAMSNFDAEAVKMHEIENSEKKESSSDSYRLQNVWSDASDSLTLSGAKQKLSGQAGRKTSGPRKFQYHPMGDLGDDVEPSYETKHATHSHGTPQQISLGSNSQNQGYFGQSNFFGQVPKQFFGMEKGNLPDLQGSTKGSDEAPFQRTVPGYVSNVSASFDGSVGISVPDKAAQSSQNMLELLHKVDQSKEHVTVTNFSSSECCPSVVMPEADNSGGSVSHLQHNQSSSSQGFSLQLAPPSQLAPVQNRALPSLNSAQTVNGPSSSLTTPEIREKGHTWLSSGTQLETLTPSHEPSKGEFKMGKIDIPQNTANENSRSSSGNVWTDVPRQQCLFGAQPHKGPLNFFQPVHSNDNMESPLLAPQNLGDKGGTRKGADNSSEFGANSISSQGLGHEDEQAVKESPGYQESIVEHNADAIHSNPLSTQKDIEAFGNFLKQNNSLQQSYSLLHQMRVMKSTETDPSDRGLKRLKETDGLLGGQKIAHETGQSNDQNTIGGDSKMLSFSDPLRNWEINASSEVGSVTSQNGPHYLHSGNINRASSRDEHSRISPQMAPSWFNKFGTLKNGQMLPINDSRKIDTVKSLEQPFTLAKPHVCMDEQSNSTEKDAADHFSSTQSLPPTVADQNVVLLRPKKRKSVTSELIPWHKEVAQGSQSLPTIRVSEVDWAKATNRLITKIEDDEMIEDGSTMLRSKRRLILTSQLMQQLLRPPPAAILSSDTRSNYESVAYLVARLALGGACSLISCSGSNSDGSFEKINIMSNKRKISGRIDDQHLFEVIEDFIDKARKLENDFLRLDKRTSVLDLRVEFQEMEKFSVINRFAKFHGRCQVDGAESSSSSNPSVNSQKPIPQRYVAALPMPKNLPDRVQCLSL